jgi:hypothetical protein
MSIQTWLGTALEYVKVMKEVLLTANNHREMPCEIMESAMVELNASNLALI